jgi:hypothetical protein
MTASENHTSGEEGIDVNEVSDATDVSHLPAEWLKWSRSRRRSYLQASGTKRGLYLTLADICEFHPRANATELTKAEMAATVVALVDNPRVDPSDVRRFE